ncbi:MAG TPA: hypothetical protein PK079_07105 [Leptospiraceae bacterium]|nr:hypothetical protein [Leptospiraceae bacterium]HMW05956.1 hypothetical protein [Leptospiraceae bacterium]HMX32112.1 hypothetical protein [Leptospiraceae bacterium]HMY32310.1 hypothetical protein [Leptospiraceae bacterium]HMZ62488.1 hypothetical protein [Leptospiraceae bacterium]
MSRKNLVSFILLCLIQIPFLILSLYFLFSEFNTICPNKDFLSWDADLRFIKTLKLMDSIRHFEFLSFAFQLLDSPTWPILRNLIQIVVFFASGVSTTSDTVITLVTFAILLGLAIHVLFYLLDKKWISVLLFLPVWLSVFLSPPILIYTFSAMLEVQGAVFFLASVYYLHLFYRDDEFIRNKSILIKLSLSTFALFQTKYPYGYLFIVAMLVLHVSLYLDETVLFFTRYIAFISHNLKKQYRLLLVILLIVSYILFPESLLKGKTKNYIKYLIILLLSFDFYLYLNHQMSQLLNLKFNRLIGIFQWVFLPIVVFVLIHPDRFSSSSSTLGHIQSEGHAVGEVVEKGLDYYLVFFKTLSSQAFIPEWVGILFLIGLIVGVVIGYIQYYKNKKIELYFLFSLFPILTILILTFFTPNHQARHIYHLLPTISIAFMLLLSSLQEKYKLVFYILVLFLSIGLIFPFGQKFASKFSGENICYTGKNKDDFFTPREVEKLFKDVKENAIFFNFINPDHVNKADTELTLSKLSYLNKLKWSIDPKIFKKHPREEGYSAVYLISDSCEKDYLPEAWFKKLHNSIQLKKIEDPKLSIQYSVESKNHSFMIGPPFPARNFMDRKIYKDVKFSTGEGCLQVIHFSILP